ncbi:MAG: four helix bundle protein [Candidatus Magasanikbacteria bacterium]
MEGSNYVPLNKLHLYQVAIELCDIAWEIYEKFDWQTKKVIGDQFVRATDSHGANIAEGYGRYHYADKNKFYYNARGSLLEGKHWMLLLYKRKLVDKEIFDNYFNKANHCNMELNKMIKRTYENKNIDKN